MCMSLGCDGQVATVGTVHRVLLKAGQFICSDELISVPYSRKISDTSVAPRSFCLLTGSVLRLFYMGVVTKFGLH
ncbi:hypothetical protein M758_8G040800 [Ceratodon purpureus]|nr:hypothetical protein M758_8G040800 [Ceratodon purpureus]